MAWNGLEGVEVVVKLPEARGIRAWSLDNRGAKAEEVQVSCEEERCTVKLGLKYRTIWYLVERG